MLHFGRGVRLRQRGLRKLLKNNRFEKYNEHVNGTLYLRFNFPLQSNSHLGKSTKHISLNLTSTPVPLCPWRFLQFINQPALLTQKPKNLIIAINLPSREHRSNPIPHA